MGNLKSVVEEALRGGWDLTCPRNCHFRIIEQISYTQLDSPHLEGYKKDGSIPTFKEFILELGRQNWAFETAGLQLHYNNHANHLPHEPCSILEMPMAYAKLVVPWTCQCISAPSCWVVFTRLRCWLSSCSSQLYLFFIAQDNLFQLRRQYNRWQLFNHSIVSQNQANVKNGDGYIFENSFMTTKIWIS